MSRLFLILPGPYAVGAWQLTPLVEVQLVRERNTLNFSIRDESRNVAIEALH